MLTKNANYPLHQEQSAVSDFRDYTRVENHLYYMVLCAFYFISKVLERSVEVRLPHFRNFLACGSVTSTGQF
jgi:hypothetical protein